MSLRIILLCALALTGLAACAGQAPMQMASTYTPPGPNEWPSPQKKPSRPPCRIYLASVEDRRENPLAAGGVGGRFVLAGEATSWLRSGLTFLDQDPRVALAETAAPTGGVDLTVRVELLKVYMLSMNTAKTANVVVRVHYRGPGAASDDHVYRGAYTSINWAATATETQGALDEALTRLLKDVDVDILKRCAGAVTSP